MMISKSIHNPRNHQPFSILMVSPNYYPFPGGLQQQAHMLSMALADTGCRVQVLTRRTSQQTARREVMDGVNVLRLPSTWSAQSQNDLVFSSFLALYLAFLAWRYDIVHIHGTSWFIAGCILPAHLWRKPVIVKMPSGRDQGVKNIHRRRLGSWRLRLLQSAKAWAVLSAESREELVAVSFEQMRIFETRNGVNTTIFSPVDFERRRELRWKLGLPVDRPIVLFTGRLVPVKRLEDLIAVWGEIWSSLSVNPVLIICGDGPLRANLEDQVRISGLQDVWFMGNISPVYEYYQAADVFVLPSSVEGNSNSMLEAMACGLPVVSTRVGGSPALLGSFASDWLVEPGDRLALRDRLVSLLSDAALRREVGNGLLQRVQQEFSIHSIARHYLECYRLLVENKANQIAGIHRAV